MATLTTVTVVDDIDGAADAHTVSFALDGTSYEIDLSVQNAQTLRDALAPYIAKGRKASTKGRQGRARRGAYVAGKTALMREWAVAQGYQVSDRGRLPAPIVEAYEAAH